MLTLAGRKLAITSLTFWVGGALLVEVAEPAAIVGLSEALPRCEHVENRARYSQCRTVYRANVYVSRCCSGCWWLKQCRKAQHPCSALLQNSADILPPGAKLSFNHR